MKPDGGTVGGKTWAVKKRHATWTLTKLARSLIGDKSDDVEVRNIDVTIEDARLGHGRVLDITWEEWKTL